MSVATTGRRPATADGRGRVLPRVTPAILLVLLALTGPYLAAHPLDKPVTAPFAPPGDGAPLGGDQLGRDVLSRLLHGGTALIGSALLVAFVVTLLAALIGCFAVLHPVVGRAVERTADVFILLPPVLGIMLIALAWPGGGRWAVISAATVLGIPYAVRVVAGAAAPLATAGYVEAALARGESVTYTATRELLPNLRGTVLALFGLRFVEAVYVISMAGFLQIGPQPPAADWALMIRENAPGILLNPWAVVAPSLTIALLAISVNLAATSLAPRSARKAVTTP
ncbi:ABC transporter permease [Streptomyces avermitilis]|uniref:Peptide ABC transporter permease protein n=2 Tax=Streptomyces avermitilis TaxID=33903 RepID=Q82BT3_STRAW|nr:MULTISPECIES: ABC transporter permease subunit [Streptomyces]KUN50443.1 ABC transporter permease [Streptomyces avermitilis]OOV30804.1 ABC transporter permease [Streptomyces avermitilis]BAC73333.1 putative peptide ABC transporter permease protein [Streptomyces avermitilis MA-4680 = NBRC 14893]GDY65796.1 transporter integral membrane protein [Streptomyces avermitilis]GDY83056.1 transporter integral membrane protein [Streptomyces avermitilis]